MSCILKRGCGILWQENRKSVSLCHFNRLYQLIWVVNTSPASSGNLAAMLNGSYLLMEFIQLCINTNQQQWYVFWTVLLHWHCKQKWRFLILMTCDVYIELFSLMRLKGYREDKGKWVMRVKQISLHVLYPGTALQWQQQRWLACLSVTIHNSPLNDWLWNGTFKLHAVLKWFSCLPWCLFCYGNSWYINITSRGSEQKIMNPGEKEQRSPPLSVN